MQGVPLLTASTDVQVLVLTADISAVIIMGWAVVRAVMAPSALFSLRWVTKLLLVLACLSFYVPIGSVVVPAGALFVHWHITRLTRRKGELRPDAVPFANGIDLTKSAGR